LKRKIYWNNAALDVIGRIKLTKFKPHMINVWMNFCKYSKNHIGDFFNTLKFWDESGCYLNELSANTFGLSGLLGYLRLNLLLSSPLDSMWKTSFNEWSWQWHVIIAAKTRKTFTWQISRTKLTEWNFNSVQVW
jgi:hypothetical protein